MTESIQYFLIREKVNNITKGAGSAFVQFAVTAMRAGYHHKLFVLHIKDLGKGSARGPDFIHIVMLVVTFGTDVFSFFHSLRVKVI
jgi:hypothetical protein